MTNGLEPQGASVQRILLSPVLQLAFPMADMPLPTPPLHLEPAIFKLRLESRNQAMGAYPGVPESTCAA